jgi:hypothetical protein
MPRLLVDQALLVMNAKCAARGVMTTQAHGGQNYACGLCVAERLHREFQTGRVNRASPHCIGAPAM